MSGQDICVIIRIMPAGEELEVELPAMTTGREIIDEVIEHGNVPKTDNEGNPYIYVLSSKRHDIQIDSQTLYDANIQNDEILYLKPKPVAGVI